MRPYDNNPVPASFIPCAALLWIGYLLAQLALDQLLFGRMVMPLWLYLLNGAAALGVLALWVRRPHAGRSILPPVIGLLTLIPILTTQAALLVLPPMPAHGPEAMQIRTMPLLLLALVLTAWQYRWAHVVGYCVGNGLFTLALHGLAWSLAGAPLLPPLIVTLIQTLSLLVVGFFVSTLMQQLDRQRQALLEANERLAAHAASLEELAISQERNRVARELHDTLAHTLSALSVQLETVNAYWEVDQRSARALLEQAQAATRSGLQETRRALKALRASPLEDFGVVTALRVLADEAAARGRLRLDLALPEKLPLLPAAVEQCLYRVAQEATANVMNHAGAQTLTVQLLADEPMMLRICDDGRGFDPLGVDAHRHYGLIGMRERALLAGGELEIVSAPGRGTTVQLTFRRSV